MSSELRATLAISKAEALNGTSRTLTLPGGRKATVIVPAEAYDGQVIRVEGQGYDGPAGTLLLTLAVIQTEETTPTSDPNLDLPTIAASSPYAQNPPTPTPTPYYQNPPSSTPYPYEQNSLTAPPPPPPPPPTATAPTPNLQQSVTFVPPPPPPDQGAPVPRRAGRGSVASRSPLARGRTILLVGLALLVIAGGVGLYFVIHANQIATTNTNATATANIAATVTANAFHATATAQASSIAATTVASNATATVQAQATATASVIAANPDPYGGGALALYDPLHDNNSGYSWAEGADNTGGNCKFTGGAYYLSELSIGNAVDCFAGSTNFSNFVFEVQMKVTKGDAGGIIFRANTTNNTDYVFFVAQEGSYELLLCPGKTCHDLVATTSSSVISQGLGQTNVIAVVAQGSTITLYVNHQQITSVTDSSYSHGEIGLVASPFSTNGHATEVVYSNARAWTL